MINNFTIWVWFDITIGSSLPRRRWLEGSSTFSVISSGFSFSTLLEDYFSFYANRSSIHVWWIICFMISFDDSSLLMVDSSSEGSSSCFRHSWLCVGCKFSYRILYSHSVVTNLCSFMYSRAVVTSLYSFLNCKVHIARCILLLNCTMYIASELHVVYCLWNVCYAII